VSESESDERRHGVEFFARDGDHAKRLYEALDIDGIDFEIALLRDCLRAYVQADPPNLNLFVKAIDQLVRALRVRYHLSEEQSRKVSEKMTATLASLTEQLLGKEAEDDL
jgi:hypothetical protein